MVIKCDQIKIGHLNAKSLFTGLNQFSNLVSHNNFDIFGVSETWLLTEMESRVVDFCVLRNDRDGRGASVCAILVK